MKLSREFYTRENVLQVAQELLGKVLHTQLEGVFCSAMITETEAYAGVEDKASHAYAGRFTGRTRIMYAEGGTAYVYLCYGIHHLFNVVTNRESVPHAVLVRAVQPLEGLETMLKRRKKDKSNYKLTAGPGSVSQAMGIHTGMSGRSLLGNEIWLEDAGIQVKKKEIAKGPRIGVDYAGADALLPYRFYIKENPWVSRL